MTASKARELSAQSANKPMETIYNNIESSSKAGNRSIYWMDLQPEQISELVNNGFTVAYRESFFDYKISW